MYRPVAWGTPELDVTHVVLDQLEGSAGGVTPSKNSKRSNRGSHCPFTRSLPLIPFAATIFASPTAAAATRSKKSTKGNRDHVNLLFKFVIMDLTRIERIENLRDGRDSPRGRMSRENHESRR
jgi:hypothetical protein